MSYARRAHYSIQFRVQQEFLWIYHNGTRCLKNSWSPTQQNKNRIPGTFIFLIQVTLESWEQCGWIMRPFPQYNWDVTKFVTQSHSTNGLISEETNNNSLTRMSQSWPTFPFGSQYWAVSESGEPYLSSPKLNSMERILLY